MDLDKTQNEAVMDFEAMFKNAAESIARPHGMAVSMVLGEREIMQMYAALSRLYVSKPDVLGSELDVEHLAKTGEIRSPAKPEPSGEGLYERLYKELRESLKFRFQDQFEPGLALMLSRHNDEMRRAILSTQPSEEPPHA